MRLVEDRLRDIIDSDLDRIVERLVASVDDIINSCELAAKTTYHALGDLETSDFGETESRSCIIDEPGVKLLDMAGQGPSTSNQNVPLPVLHTHSLSLPTGVSQVSQHSTLSTTIDSGYQTGACPCSCHFIIDMRTSHVALKERFRNS